MIKKICAVFYIKTIGNNMKKLIFLIAVSSLIIYIKAVEYGLAFEHSVFELLAYSFANNINLIFIHTLIMLILVNNILIKRKEELHFIIRMNHRRGLYILNMINIILTSFLWVIANIISSIIMSCNNKMFSSRTSVFLTNSLENITSRADESVLKQLFLLNTNILLYFICVGLLYYVLYLLLEKEIFSLILTFSIILCNYIIHLCKIEELYRFLLVSNVSYQFMNENYAVNLKFWGIFLLLMIVMGLLILRKFNFYGNSKIRKLE